MPVSVTLYRLKSSRESWKHVEEFESSANSHAEVLAIAHINWNQGDVWGISIDAFPCFGDFTCCHERLMRAAAGDKVIIVRVIENHAGYGMGFPVTDAAAPCYLTYTQGDCSLGLPGGFPDL